MSGFANAGIACFALTNSGVMINSIPAQFARTIVDLFDDAGRDWLNRLPAIVAECERRWSLTVLPPFAPLTYNYVAPALRADGTHAVLKVSFPEPQVQAEIAALRLFDGSGSVRLLAADPDGGLLLLEHLKPGTPLSTLMDDEAATSIAAAVMRQLWRPVPKDHAFPSVSQWAAGLGRLREEFGGTTGPLPRHLVEEAESHFGQLIASMDKPMILHGDLHHDNILAAERAPWLALDPKGLVGESAYEVGALLRNVAPQFLVATNLRDVLSRRVRQFSDELGFDRKRLRAWGLAQAVLSAWWSLEDHGHGWEWAISCAEALAQVNDC